MNDAFGAAHRAHASVEALVHLMPAAGAGLLMETELRYLVDALTDPARPFVAVLGGAKVSDKIEMIENLVPRVDRLIIGGAMAYTFFKAMGKPVGKSLVEDDKLDAARDILAQAAARNLPLLLPTDHVVAPKLEAGAPTETHQRGRRRHRRSHGPGHRAPHRARLRRCAGETPRPWCGTGRWASSKSMQFAQGTMAVAQAVASVSGISIVGGGDSIAAVNKAGLADAHLPHLDRRRRVARAAGRPDRCRGWPCCPRRSSVAETSPMRTPIIAGNWKMYKTVADAVKYVKEFRSLVKDVDRRRDRGGAAVHRRSTPWPRRPATAT